METIQLINICKNFDKPSLFFWNKNSCTKALDNVTIQCPKHKISCILGPNGAGKTTIIKILAGLIIQDSGEINFSQTMRKKIKIGLMTPNERSFYWRLTGRQNLEFFAELYGIERKKQKFLISHLLEEFSLHKEADKPFRLYSTGMKYKLLIIRALIGDPDILILDEPTSHIDPVTRDNIHVFIRQYIISQCRKTVILCTHDLSEAQTLADHLILLNKGKVIAQGTFNELNKLIKSEIIYEICFFIKPDDVFFKNYPDFYFDREAGFYQFELPTINAVPELIRKAVEYNGKIRWCKDHKETLFEIFKRLTNNN